MNDNVVLRGAIENVLPSYFDCIDEKMVAKAVRLTQGAGGPSHMDADQYRHMLFSNKYKKESKELREQIAILARKISSTIVDPATLEAYIACRLIPLAKNPAV